MTTVRDVRKRRYRKARGRPSPPLALDQRLTRMSQNCRTHVAYSLAMLGGKIDRGAWAREVDALVVRFDPGPRGDGNRSAFARRIGMTRQTLTRWATRATDISPESARQVLDKLSLPQREQIELLTRVGYLIDGMPEPPDPRKDPVIAAIMADPTWTDDQRAELVQVQLDRIEADLARRRAEYEQLVRLRLGKAAS
jgi:hypothetical protein